jgi:hypothetical protein
VHGFFVIVLTPPLKLSSRVLGKAKETKLVSIFYRMAHGLFQTRQTPDVLFSGFFPNKKKSGIYIFRIFSKQEKIHILWIFS